MSNRSRSSSGATLRRVALVVATFALGIAGLPALAVATITASDFPAKSEVKAAVGGKGVWAAFPADITTLGSKPRGCRSDKQLLDFDEVKAKAFFGRESGTPRPVRSGAEIVILRYATVASARDAVKRNGSYPQRCAKVTEWVCTDCDGISTTWRTRVAAREVGRQSVAWRFRRIDNSKSNGYTVVARRGSTVVRVTVSRTRDVPVTGEWVYPQRIKKRVAVRLARLALRSAT
jgi:hypothetical protein